MFSGFQFDGFAGMVWAWTTAFAPRLLAAALILVAGLAVARWLSRTVGSISARTNVVDATVRPFLIAAVRYGISILVLILVLGQLGIETTSLLAVLGAAGLAVGLALQGTLSNIAAGIMLLWLRPFQVGDYIEVNAISGTVENTGLFSCDLRTFDGVRLFAPNSTIWNAALRNHSKTQRRLIALSVTLAAGTAEDAAIAALKAALEGDDRLAASPAPDVFLESYNASGAVLTYRLWTKAKAYNEVQRTIVAQLRQRLMQAGAAADSIQIIGRNVPGQADISRLVDF